MRKTSVRELHIHTSALVREAAEGGVIVMERRGVPVAELRAISGASRMSSAAKARIFRAMKEVRDRMPMAAGSAEAMEEDRNR